MFLLINSEDSSGMDLSIWKFHHYMLQSIISEQMKSFNWSFVDVLIEKDICYGTRFPLFLIPLNYGTHSASEDRLFGVDGRCLCVDDYEEEKLMVKGREYGLLCWTKAIQLRETTDGEPAFPKVPHNLSEFARKSFENVPEFTTMKQLMQISNSRYSKSKLFWLASEFWTKLIRKILFRFFLRCLLYIRDPSLTEQHRQHHRAINIALPHISRYDWYSNSLFRKTISAHGLRSLIGRFIWKCSCATFITWLLSWTRCCPNEMWRKNVNIRNGLNVLPRSLKDITMSLVYFTLLAETTIVPVPTQSILSSRLLVTEPIQYHQFITQLSY